MPNGAVVYEASRDGAFRQAEIVCAVKQLKRDISVGSSETPIPIHLVNHPFAIIVSQDCDLDLDFSARNGLIGPEGGIVGPGKKFLIFYYVK